jgi:hypothetical protein
VPRRPRRRGRLAPATRHRSGRPRRWSSLPAMPSGSTGRRDPASLHARCSTCALLSPLGPVEPYPCNSAQQRNSSSVNQPRAGAGLEHRPALARRGSWPITPQTRRLGRALGVAPGGKLVSRARLGRSERPSSRGGHHENRRQGSAGDRGQSRHRACTGRGSFAAGREPCVRRDAPRHPPTRTSQSRLSALT